MCRYGPVEGVFGLTLLDAPPCGKSQLQDTMSQQPKLSSCNDSPGGVARSTMPPSPDHPESEACHLVPNAEELVPVSVRSDLKFFWGVPLSTHAPSAHADSVAIGRPPEAAYAKYYCNYHWTSIECPCLVTVNKTVCLECIVSASDLTSTCKEHTNYQLKAAGRP